MVNNIDSANGEISSSWPWFLSDGKHFSYVAYLNKGAVFRVGSLDSKDSKVIFSSDEMSNIDVFVADIIEAKEKKKNVWARWYDRLGSFYDERFTGPNWREKQKEFWDKKLKEYSGL